MAESSTDSPLEAAADMVGPRATEAFSLLGDETRLAILLTLWEALDPFETDPTDYTDVEAIPFSELRRRVGVRDPGQFHYHLDQLVGRFVEKTDDGFELRQAGKQVVQTVIATAGLEQETFPRTEIDAECPNCNASTAITYQNNRLYQCCTECEGNYSLGDHHPDAVLNGWRSNPAVLSHPSAAEIHRAGRTKATNEYALRFEGICPICSGRIERTLHVCEDHERSDGQPCPTCNRPYEIAARFVCSVCKAANICSAVKFLLLTRQPSVDEFLGKHDIVPEYPFVSETPSLTTEQAVESVDPLRVRMTLTIENDEIHLLVDEDFDVVEQAN